MARARNIKPGFFKNPELVELPFEYRLLYIGLWCLADREGRLEDRPKQIRMELFPGDNVDVNAGLHALEAAGLIVRYEAEGKALAWIPTFLEHQNPHPREVPSTLPPYLGPAKGQTHDLFSNAKVVPIREKALAGPADVLNPDVLNPDSSTSGRARATRLPPDWLPTEEQVAWAMTEQSNWSREHTLKVAASFRDYWIAKPGKDGVKADWPATWRNWVRKEGPMRAATGASVTEHNERLREELRREAEAP